MRTLVHVCASSSQLSHGPLRPDQRETFWASIIEFTSLHPKAVASLASGQEDTGGGEGAGSAGSAGVSTLQEPQQLCAGVPCGAEQEEGALWRQ